MAAWRHVSEIPWHTLHREMQSLSQLLESHSAQRGQQGASDDHPASQPRLQETGNFYPLLLGYLDKDPSYPFVRKLKPPGGDAHMERTLVSSVMSYLGSRPGYHHVEQSRASLLSPAQQKSE